ncbi:MAG: family 10 glycosylhydrolase [Bacteroidales bacterium]
MKLTKQFITLILVILFTAQSFAAEISPKREVRSVWLTTVWGIDWPSVSGTSTAIIESQKNSLTTMLESLEADNFNTVYFQVRSMCDAFYKSSYEPWSSYLTGTRGSDPGWDPLEFAVEECHKRGMECHAWVNPYRYSSGSVWTTEQDQALEDSGILMTYGTYTILNPGKEESRERIVNVCRELATNYEIDGIIFDDYFYISGTPSNSTAGDYTDWQNSGTTLTIANWRRANVNQMVEDVYTMIQSIKPWIRFGISPAGVAGTSSTSASVYDVTPCPKGSDWQYNGIYSDPLAWLDAGTIDYISPQLYWSTTHSTNPFGPLTEWWSYIANHFGRHHYASHSISDNTNTTAYHTEVAQQIEYSRTYTENDASGAVFYSTKYIVGETTTTGGALGNYIKENKFQNRALPPAITWKDYYPFQSVSNLKQDGTTLTWDAASGIGIIKYSVYAIPTSISESEAAGNYGTGYESTYLLGVTYSNEYTISNELSTDYWYAVCVVDGYGNEFEAATINEPGGTPADVVTLTSPIDSEIVSATETFSWSSATDATYRIQISDNALFSTIEIDVTSLTTNSYVADLSALAPETLYYWRIITSQSEKSDSKSAYNSFTTEALPSMTITTLISPSAGATVEGSATFICSNVEADTYTLQISADSSFANIAYSSTDWSSSGSNMELTRTVDIFANGDYFWRVITSKDGYKDSYSTSQTFTIAGNTIDPDEPTYIKMYDQDSYEAKNNVTLESLWIRSVDEAYSNFTTLSELGINNRSICVVDNIIYMVGRSEASTTADCYLEKYNATTGAHIGTLDLSSDIQTSYYPCNDIYKDSEGNICISNLTLNITTAPLKIYTPNLTTGEVTLVASCSGNSVVSQGRIDYSAVYGDITSGNFTVYAAIASSSNVIRWTYLNSTLSKTELCTLQSLTPTTASDLGIAPRVLPISDSNFIVTGGSTVPTQYIFSTGNTDGVFSNRSSLMPDGMCCNGGTIFPFMDGTMYVYPYSDHEDGYSFNIVSMDSDASYSSMSQYWTIPQSGIGTINSQTWSTIADYQLGDKTSTEETAIIYIYVPGNGLAAYQLKYSENTSVESLESKELKAIATTVGINFNQEVETAELYNLNGQLISTAKNTVNMQINLSKGTIYILRTTYNNNISTEKILIQ